MTQIIWTRTEAMACAYCWAEFSAPEDRDDTPEQYWLRVAERTRQECRKIVNDRFVLAVAFREAAPVFPASHELSMKKADEIAVALHLKQRSRIYAVIQAVHHAFQPPRVLK